MATPLQQLPATAGLGVLAERAIKAKDEKASLRVTDEFCAWAKKEISEYRDTGDPAKLLIYRRWMKVALYDRGNQLIMWSAEDESYRPLPSEDTDLHHVVNYFTQIIDSLVTEYIKSKPKLTAYSRAGDDQRIKDSIDTAQYLIECFRPTLWDRRQAHREARLVILRGGVFTRTYVDKFAGEPIEVPEYAAKMKMVQAGQFACPHCGVQGSLGLGPEGLAEGQEPQPPDNCPRCQNAPIDIQSMPILSKVVEAAGVKKVPSGEIRSEPIDPFEVEISDRATGPWDSPYLRWDHIEDNYKLQLEFPHWDPEKKGVGAGLSTDRMLGLYYARQIELEPGNLGAADQTTSAYFWGAGRMGSGASNLTGKRTAIRTQIHFRRGTYDEKKFDQDVFIDPTQDRAIPAGMTLGEVFPHGLKLVFINGELVKAEDFDMDWEWDAYTCTVPTRGFYGNGAEQYVSIQDWLNDGVSLSVTAAMMLACGILVADKNRLEGLTGRPGDIVSPIDPMVNEPLGNLIEHISINSNSGQIQEMISMCKADMVNIAGARSPDWGGEPSQTPGKQLATGINYNNAIANAAAGMKLELRAENWARRMEQALFWFRNATVYPRYMRTLDGQKGRWLRGYQIGADIKVKVEDDSAQPLTSLERRGNLLAAKQAGYGQVQPDGKTPVNTPFMERLLAKAFVLDEDPAASNDWATIAYNRIDKMVATCKVAQKYAAHLEPQQAEQFLTLQILRAGLEREDYDLMDPEAVTPAPGEKHGQLLEQYENFYVTDEYRNLELPVKKALDKLRQLHFAAIQKDQAEKMATTQQLLGPSQPKATPEPKAPSISVKFETLPDEAKYKVLAEAGIDIDPRAFDHKRIQDQRDAAAENQSPTDQGQASEQAPQPTQGTDLTSLVAGGA